VAKDVPPVFCLCLLWLLSDDHDQIFPIYFYHLDDKAKAIYKEKLQMLGVIDNLYVDSASSVSSVDCHKWFKLSIQTFTITSLPGSSWTLFSEASLFLAI
jgi:hypothetical protein